MKNDTSELSNLPTAFVKKLQNYDELKKRQDESEKSYALIVIGILALICLALGIAKTDSEDWFSQWQFTCILLSIIFSTLWLGVFIERTLIFKVLWNSIITKCITSITISGLIIFCTAKSSALLNGVFGIDSSSFPYTRSFLTGFLFLKYINPILSFILITLFAIHIIKIAYYLIKHENFHFPPISSFATVVFTFLIFIFILSWQNSYFSEKNLPVKTYALAHLLDFSINHHCINLDTEKVSVVFIGSSQDKVLIDDSDIYINSIESFLKGNSSSFFMKDDYNFKIKQCVYN
ncbi:hypothetical protein AB241_20125 [Salmonella enterica]|nr:hypothetical protein [Salmonella enterica]EDR6194572.1 hypothetical protein [Salmonella enterica subsp. enterica serovar Aqua]EAX1486697.1 hypothetical protein [Salmonella enterica]EAY6932034.1 hypothetical protein [Salmonella enterica]EBA6160211.1 hypothetical protein [Salmonella enterica]